MYELLVLKVLRIRHFTRPILWLIKFKAIKLFKKTNWCFLSIKWCWKMLSFIFDKNIKKWQRFIVFFFKSKFYIFILTVKIFQKLFCSYRSYLLCFFPKTKRIFSTMIFWDNWIKKFSEKFIKIVIVSSYGINEWSKGKVIRIR